MGRTPADTTDEGERRLVTFVRFDKVERQEHWKLIMHREVADALDQLGWRLNV